ILCSVNKLCSRINTQRHFLFITTQSNLPLFQLFLRSTSYHILVSDCASQYGSQGHVYVLLYPVQSFSLLIKISLANSSMKNCFHPLCAAPITLLLHSSLI